MTQILSSKNPILGTILSVTSNFIQYDQDQQHLLPKNLAEWVKEDSLERYVPDVIDHLDNEGRLDPFYPEEREDGRGRPSFHPVMMLKVLVFGYCIGIRSSANSTVSSNVTSRFATLPRINSPTSARSASSARTTVRSSNTSSLRFFVSVGKLGWLRWAKSPWTAVASRATLPSTKTGLVNRLPKRSRTSSMKPPRSMRPKMTNTAPNTAGTSSPEELREQEDRLDRLREAKNRLDAKEQQRKAEQAAKIRQREREEEEMGRKKRGRKPTPPEEVELPEDTKANTTDPASQTLKTSNGWKQGYNGQAMVDCDTQVIVAQDITTDANDVQQLKPI